jgi:hypothetical protein
MILFSPENPPEQSGGFFSCRTQADLLSATPFNEVSREGE